MTRAYKIAAVIVFLLCTQIHAQQNGYLIRNYLPKEYDGYSQIWQAAQDKNGLLFFAGTTNVFIHDGVSWEKVLVKQGAANRQVAYDTTTGTIYCGAVGEFGYLQRAVDGHWTFVSLLGKVPDEYRVFADIWKIHLHNGKVYFQASERIFVFKDGNYVTSIEAVENTFALSFLCANRLFVRQRNVGLHEIINDKLVLLPGGEAYATVPLLSMLPWRNDSAIVISYGSGITMMDLTPTGGTTNCFGEFFRQPDEFLLHAGVLGADWIDDTTFVIFSRSGLGFYGRDGVLRELLTKASGLYDESIAELFVDREKNLWLCTNYGITRVAHNNPVYYYDSEGIGVKGTFENLIQHNQQTYVATIDGLWINQPDAAMSRSSLYFEAHSKQKMECWSLGIYGSDLLACTGTGLLRVNGSETEMIAEGNTSVFTLTQKPGELITGVIGGFNFIEMEPGKPPTRVVYAELPAEEILRLSPADTIPGQPDIRDFWSSNRFRNLHHIQMNIRTGEIEYRIYDTVNGLPDFELFPIRLNDSVYFLNFQNCYRYHADRDVNDSSKCFTAAPDIYGQVSYGDISTLQPPFDYRMFTYSKSDSATVFGNRSDGTIIRERFLMNQVPITDVQFAFTQPEGIVWLMTLDQMLRVDLNRKTNRDVNFSTHISRVMIGEDSVIFYGSADAENTYRDNLSYKHNSVSFHYAAPFFDHEKQIRYSYMLEGYDTAWSKWNYATEKNYTNLPEGTYTFLVKAHNVFEKESKVASFTFTILPPWYRTVWAYSLYGVVFIGTLWGSVRMSARRLRQQKEKLEQLVKERTAEVVEQKHQIEKQKVDLEEAYTGIQDSIVYSQRIQNAILPTSEEIKRIVPDSFVLFFPRDIVSGDFYWFAEKNGLKFIACVDCTGHGVPGALMSMIGNTILNQIIIEKNITSPDQVLNHLHSGVRQALKQDAGGDTRDGMDLSLIVIDEAKSQLAYAGANRNLWIVRNNELLEIKADKFPIAGSQLEEQRRFTAHTIPLQKGDVIYLTTDGYADQFGGDKGKKFMVRQLTRVLLDIHSRPMQDQRFTLEQKFFEWKQSHEQVDDVLVIGIRV